MENSKISFLFGWRTLVLIGVVFAACEEPKKSDPVDSDKVKITLDSNELYVLFEEPTDTGQTWFMRIDSARDRFMVSKWGANGLHVGKVFDKSFRLTRIDWYNSEGSYAHTEYHSSFGNYAYGYSHGLELDTTFNYLTEIVPDTYKKRRIVSVSSDFIPIQSVFLIVNAKCERRYDIPNNTVHLDFDSTFTQNSIELTYTVFVENDLIRFDTPITVTWPDEKP